MEKKRHWEVTDPLSGENSVTFEHEVTTTQVLDFWVKKYPEGFSTDMLTEMGVRVK